MDISMSTETKPTFMGEYECAYLHTLAQFNTKASIVLNDLLQPMHDAISAALAEMHSDLTKKFVHFDNQTDILSFRHNTTVTTGRLQPTLEQAVDIRLYFDLEQDTASVQEIVCRSNIIYTDDDYTPPVQAHNSLEIHISECVPGTTTAGVGLCGQYFSLSNAIQYFKGDGFTFISEGFRM